MITILQVFCLFFAISFWSKSDYVVLLHQSLCLLAFAFLLTPPPITFTALYCHCHQHYVCRNLHT